MNNLPSVPMTNVGNLAFYTDGETHVMKSHIKVIVLYPQLKVEHLKVIVYNAQFTLQVIFFWKRILK